ncbi:MAG: PLP-dependent transferase, partial [Candidatus Gastranaerophilales bacterium]|nr:PLP-dependent transferase [Candidatus Gastranaerophilales bacterium]
MKFETIAAQGFLDLQKQNKAVSTPIYANTAYSFDSVQYAVDLFDLKIPGDIYSRLSNPTNEIMEKRIAALEGGIGALAASSGLSAVLMTMLN